MAEEETISWFAGVDFDPLLQPRQFAVTSAPGVDSWPVTLKPDPL
jgi:hypothetical protein